MRFLMLGGGAIGTYVGGSLALSGQDVAWVERPEAAETLRLGGLRLIIDGNEQDIHLSAVFGSLADALDQGRYDAAVLAVKAYDTPAITGMLAPLAARMPTLLCLQNGVENESRLAAVLGEEKVIAGTVTSAVGRLGIGAIRLERLRGMGIAVGNPLSASLVRALSDAGLKAVLYPSAPAMKWSKLITNLLANASSAILDWTAARVFAHPRMYRVEVEQVREALAVMRTLNVPVVDLPGTPVRLLAWALGSLPPGVSRPLVSQAVGAGRGGKMPSFHIDLHSGRGQSEVHDLNGAVVRAGRLKRVATPVNRVLDEILGGLTEGSISLDEYRDQPDRLINRVNTARKMELF